ncbi:MAG: hypothetical protein HKN77_05590, partial [Woeseiaceae bacterium]|nr:hypothetical protein [Woeseiaceae bacterium]
MTAEQSITAALNSASLPGIDYALQDVGRIRALACSADTASIEIELGFPCDGQKAALAEFLGEVAQTAGGLSKASVTVGSK